MGRKTLRVCSHQSLRDQVLAMALSTIRKWLGALKDKTPSENWETGPAVNPLLNSRNVWYIHGKPYDLRPMMSWHPGGKDILRSCEVSDLVVK